MIVHFKKANASVAACHEALPYTPELQERGTEYTVRRLFGHVMPLCKTDSDASLPLFHGIEAVPPGCWWPVLHPLQRCQRLLHPKLATH